MILPHKARFILALTVLIVTALFISCMSAYASNYTAGATNMPLYSTSQWTLKDATLKRISGDSVSISGSTVKALKSGSSVIAVLDSNKKELKRFTIKVYVLSDTYVLESALGGGLVADIKGASLSNEANIQLWSSNGTKAQMFKFSASKGSYVITNANSNKAIDVKSGSKMAGANIQQYMTNGTNAQKWTLEVDSKNYVTFKNVKSGMAMDVASAKPQEGRNIQQYSSNKTVAQKWRIILADNYKAAKAKIRGHWTYKTVNETITRSELSVPEAPGDAIALSAMLLTGGVGPQYTGKSTVEESREAYPTSSGYSIYRTVNAALAWKKGTAYFNTNYRKKRHAECSAFVTRAVMWSGYDDAFCTGLTVHQAQYMTKSKKWVKIGEASPSVLKPGDILISKKCVDYQKGGHIFIYAGPSAAKARWGQGCNNYYAEAAEDNKFWPSATTQKVKDLNQYYIFRATGTFIDKNSVNYKIAYDEKEKHKIETKITTTTTKKVKDQFIYDNYKITYRGLPSNMKVTSPTTFKYDTLTFSITAPSGSKAGYTFIGWYTKAQGGTKITNIQKGTAQDYVLYAHFEKNVAQTSSKKSSNTSVKDSTTSNPVSIKYGWIALDSKKNPILVGSQYTLSGQVKPIAYISDGRITKTVNTKSIVYLNNNKKGTAQALIIGDNIVGCKDAFFTTFTIV